MAGQTIGGLFKNVDTGEAALDELRRAGYTSAQISELSDTDTVAPKKLSNPIADFFSDHTATGSDFQDNLTHLGMSRADAEYFENGVARGGALVTVKADEGGADAMAILTRYGADLGSLRGGSATTGATATGLAADKLTAEQTLELREERLSIDKTRVASGAVRIGKRVVTEQQSINVPVSHEEIVIDRHAVTSGATGGVIGDDQTITVPLSRDQVNVSKQTYTTEEVAIGKREVGETQTVGDTIRREELVVDGDVDTDLKAAKTTPLI